MALLARKLLLFYRGLVVVTLVSTLIVNSFNSKVKVYTVEIRGEPFGTQAFADLRAWILLAPILVSAAAVLSYAFLALPYKACALKSDSRAAIFAFEGGFLTAVCVAGLEYTHQEQYKGHGTRLGRINIYDSSDYKMLVQLGLRAYPLVVGIVAAALMLVEVALTLRQDRIELNQSRSELRSETEDPSSLSTMHTQYPSVDTSRPSYRAWCLQMALLIVSVVTLGLHAYLTSEEAERPDDPTPVMDSAQTTVCALLVIGYIYTVFRSRRWMPLADIRSTLLATLAGLLAAFAIHCLRTNIEEVSGHGHDQFNTSYTLCHGQSYCAVLRISPILDIIYVAFVLLDIQWSKDPGRTQRSHFNNVEIVNPHTTAQAASPFFSLTPITLPPNAPQHPNIYVQPQQWHYPPTSFSPQQPENEDLPIKGAGIPAMN